MPAIFKTYDDEWFEYQGAKEVKEKGSQYVVYDAYGSTLGAHQIEDIQQFTTDPLVGEKIKAPKS